MSMTLQSQLLALSELKDSRGWKLVSAALKHDLLELSMALGYDAEMSDTRMHFVRGEIAAARKFAGYVDRMYSAVEVELRIQDAKKPVSEQAEYKAEPLTRPAKAGQEN